MGRDSTAGIATRYGLDGPGIESWWRWNFPQLTLGPTQPPIQWVPGLFLQGKVEVALRWPPSPIYCPYLTYAFTGRTKIPQNNVISSWNMSVVATNSLIIHSNWATVASSTFILKPINKPLLPFPVSTITLRYMYYSTVSMVYRQSTTVLPNDTTPVLLWMTQYQIRMPASCVHSFNQRNPAAFCVYHSLI